MTDPDLASFFSWLQEGYADLTAETYTRAVKAALASGKEPEGPAGKCYRGWAEGRKPNPRRGPNRQEQVDQSSVRLWVTNRNGEEVNSFLISPSDLLSVERHRWSLGKKGAGNLYAQTWLPKEGERDRRMTALHRFLAQPPPNYEVDHINGNTLDNRRENLRIVTRAQQAQNVPARGRSGYRNVYYRRGFWWVKVVVGGKAHYGGNFRTPEEANESAKTLRQKLHTAHNEARCSPAPG